MGCGLFTGCIRDARYCYEWVSSGVLLYTLDVCDDPRHMLELARVRDRNVNRITDYHGSKDCDDLVVFLRRVRPGVNAPKLLNDFEGFLEERLPKGQLDLFM